MRRNTPRKAHSFENKEESVQMLTLSFDMVKTDFFDYLQARHFDNCQTLLTILRNAGLHHEYRFHQDLLTLAQVLIQDEADGFAQFRAEFFAALDRRWLDDCESLIKVLAVIPHLRWEQLYHQAILHHEFRQFDQGEIILHRLLKEKISLDRQARASIELANQFVEQGQWTKAEQFYQDALQAYQSSANELGQAKVYNNLGISICLRVQQGELPVERLAKTCNYHQQALDLLTHIEGPVSSISRNFHGLGKAYALRGDYLAATQYFQQDLALGKSLEDPYGRAVTLSDQAGLVDIPQNRWAEAAEALDEAIPIIRQFEDNLFLAEALTRRGQVFWRQQQFDKAQTFLTEAIERVEAIQTDIHVPSVRANHRKTVEFIYTALISFHLQQGNADQAFTTLERARARVLADLLANQTALPHTDTVPDLSQKQAEIRQALDQAVAEALPPSAIERLLDQLADIELQIELEDQAYQSLKSSGALTSTEICQQLSAEAAIVTYIADIDDQLWILVATVAGVTAKRINQLKYTFLQTYLTSNDSRGALTPERKMPQLLSQSPIFFYTLFDFLIAPVLEILQAMTTIYIVPFGSLYYLPLGALAPNQDSGPPLLASGKRVVYAPSATILLNYHQVQPKSSHRDLLALAPSGQGLAYTFGGAVRLARQWSNESLTLSGVTATRQKFLDQAGKYRLICFLGHAEFNHRHPMLSHLEFSDGPLRANEILRALRLQADLVILAACQTGLGQVLRGDEIMGLSRAMLYAGTTSLLVTLWEVPEISTCLLVEKVIDYLHAAPDFDPATALAAAQGWLKHLDYQAVHAVLKTWGLSEAEIEAHLTAFWQMIHPQKQPLPTDRPFDHPFFWSAYILIGDARRGSSA